MAKRNSLKNLIRLIDDANDEMPVEQSFLSDLKRSIELTADKEARKPSQTYKPSGMNCIRASYYQVSGIEPDESHSSFTSVGICNSGTDIHVRMQTAIEGMKENGIDCEYVDVAEFVKMRGLDELQIVSKSGMETKLFYPKYNMSFMCDGIIRYKGHYYILELKTENSYKFMNRKDVDPSHYNQGTAYSLAFGLNEVLFVYISRDVLDMRAFILNVTDEMRERLVNYITTCDAYVKEKRVPPKPENVLKKSCTYCGYASQCRKDG